MPPVFVDTDYWMATIDHREGLHQRALTVSTQLSSYRFVTSEMVLVEVLNSFAKYGTHLREAAVTAVEAIESDPRIEVIPQTRQLFQGALALFRQRLDKDWRLTDCASFTIMDQRGIGEALTNDHHFEQNGYKALLRQTE